MQIRHHAPESEETGIDLAPMLDFTINLLIFFIIITSFIKETGVKVIKPEAVTAEHRDTGNLLIAIRENNDIWMGGERIEQRELRALIERLHIERPDDTVVIIADQDSDAGVVAKVMDEVKAGGISEMSIAAEPGG
ncbi:MAG TPA: biopolymer transporter ExbD [Gammaproteobacteria bacterium]|nr:biopolymer transporter ExbD [Gammaproteobacteria bacterium]